jgi:sugar lactone lactonase YvrE
MNGSADERMNNLGEMAVAADGTVYVVDRGNYRIQRFSGEGVYLGQWGSRGSGDGQFEAPAEIAITPNGFVYVSDAALHRVQRFDLDGNYLGQWTGPGAPEAPFAAIASLAATHDVVFVAEGGRERIHKFGRGGDYLTGWGINRTSSGQLNGPEGLAVTGDTVYVVDGANDRVQLFTRDGSYLAAWGRAGSGDGQFDHPVAIDVASDGTVYVVDEGNFRVQKFSAAGEFISQWGGQGDGPGQFAVPSDLAIDAAGFVYVVDRTTAIQKFTAEGALVTTWTHGESGSKYGIAIDSQGYLYTVNLLTVQKFAPNGAFVTEWGAYGSGEGQFIGPQGIAIDSHDRIYVADTFNRRVQIFSPEGEFLATMGRYGSGDGQLLVPLRAAVSSEGDVFVSDNRLSRIVKYAAQRPPADPQSGLIANGSFEITPGLAGWTYGHDFAEPAVSTVNQASDSATAVQLGRPVSQEPQDRSTAWLYQTVYVDPNWRRPLLSFDYRMFVNDTIDYSDFYVWMSSSQGGWKATLLRDGFRSCNSPATAPPAGFDLGWRSTGYDLSPFKGQTIRIRFENRNLHQDLSLGAWTYVDNVRVLDMAGTLVEPSLVYLPCVNGGACDKVTP